MKLSTSLALLSIVLIAGCQSTSSDAYVEVVAGDYRALAGYGHNDGRYQRAYNGHGGRYSTRRRGYGYGYDHDRGYGHGRSEGAAWHGAYGRPDLVYPGGQGGYGRGDYGRGRDPHRVDWCRATYRSYDPGSGYYRAWSGRLIFCG